MSYSISATGATKDAIREALASKMADVVAQQPIHEADKDKALAVADNFLSMLPDSPPAGQQFCVALHGSVCKSGDDFTSAGAGTTAYFIPAAQ